MRIRNYKRIENMAHYFGANVWRALHKLGSVDDYDVDYIELQGDKIVAVYYGYVPCDAWGTYNELEDVTRYTIPNREWKKLLISFGFVPKNKKTYFGKYYNRNFSKKEFIK